MILPFPVSKKRLLSLIYENQGITYAELVRQARLSVATAKKALDEFRQVKAIREEELRGKKKVILRKFYPNFASEEGQQLLILLELDKKNAFFEKHKAFAGPLQHFLREIKKYEFLLVFGSYARGAETPDSDLDLLLVIKSRKAPKLQRASELAFVTLRPRVALRTEPLSNFKIAVACKDAFHLTILQNHIVVAGAQNYIKAIAQTAKS